MEKIFRQIPLYRFLMVCNEENSDKRILDCGAGGDCPPLSLFSKYGYQTTGIEFDEEQLKRAQKFGDSHGQCLGIQLGDMRTLPFPDEHFGNVYSYNSIFHMKKVDIEKSILEMKRVLKSNGLMFVNFLSTDDFRCGEGPCVGDNEYEQMDDVPVIHSYFTHSEADRYFEDMKILYKEVRILERVYEGELIRQGFIDYIVRK
ncbi:ubiquinone/menaquinone biosynthesis C-methylase UbiE [Anaerosolibacter carboniphilus]|uniref:Ubiquinone/menaquinone biosynthesis C-methylase UbiE n=1 Tax=Anaerosolibacter carboniphilus TaxID=1417629 RepID=A0A841KUI7_9FIRM|nr:class I SAM-dependent methyltransferase [Anaerosolibacter carboniphilus]MBB6217023.1 ubiquinone/menaquinone biosynthesis C-methylase UbiE [Anaerosolibacter carboniphilus]